MQGGDWAFVGLAINPLGGLWLAIPLAYFHLKYPAWLCVLAGVPLAYVQVAAVDLAWEFLDARPWWRPMIEKRRSARIERMLAGQGTFWGSFILAPLLGPWIIMAFMRYAQVPQRKVALPIVLGMCWIAVLITSLCVFLPEVIKS